MIRFVDASPKLDINEVVATMKKFDLSFSHALKKRYWILECLLNVHYPEAGLKTETTSLKSGERIWFLCPECENRAGKLFVINSELACRKCHELRYECQYYHRESFYEDYLKHFKNYNKLVNKLKNGKVQKKELEAITKEIKRLKLVLMDASNYLLEQSKAVKINLTQKYESATLS